MKNKIHVFSMVKFLPLSPEAKAYKKLCTTFKKLRYQLVHENCKKNHAQKVLRLKMVFCYQNCSDLL